ncbi:class II aldolase/adducin family protein [Rubrivivax rivuli]|uniref:Class II aldolase n=1 Tax=Rubrivivax rivuli TaxID=1862385 RepID=A0A437RH96_9BURK|nr:class II aldolase/adducin family protein [Rubrivivax rivuli]RVU46140.1 class II aldolase [Rubrivivax rivuli]
MSAAALPQNPEFANETTAREAAVAAVRRLDASGMNRGSTGNLSLRWVRLEAGAPHDGMLITPTGMGADDLRAQDLVWVAIEGQGDAPRVVGDWQPSSEWHFHRAAYRARPDVQAVVHTHAPNATALACLDRPLPAFHYMVAIAGGVDVPLVPYNTFGTEALSQGVGQALRERDACLLAHHGLVSAARTLAQAMKVMQEIETLCEVYLKALAVGEPALLSAGQMSEVIGKFRGYGKSARR